MISRFPGLSLITARQAARMVTYPSTHGGSSPVSRIDNVYGDRNLVCSCVPMEDYAEAAS